MKKRVFAYGLAALIGLPLVVGCPTGTTTPTVPTASSLKGKVLFNGQAQGNLYVGLRTNTGGTWAAIADRSTTTASDGTFSFSGLNDGSYQPYFNDQGQIVTSGEVNTAGVYAVDPVSVSAAQTTTPNVEFDVYWLVNPNPTPGQQLTTFPYSFGWSPNTKVPSTAEYQVLVSSFNADSNTVGTAQWSSAWMTGNSVAWNGQSGSTTNTPAGGNVANGNYVYQVKFRKQGGDYAGGNFYGQTKWIRFTIQRAG